MPTLSGATGPKPIQPTSHAPATRRWMSRPTTRDDNQPRLSLQRRLDDLVEKEEILSRKFRAGAARNSTDPANESAGTITLPWWFRSPLTLAQKFCRRAAAVSRLRQQILPPSDHCQCRIQKRR
jgi:hypothetical protein